MSESPSTVVADGSLVELQQLLDALLDAPPSGQTLARATFQALRSLTVMVLYLGTPDLLAVADGAVLDRFERHCEGRDDESPRKGVTGPAYRTFGVTPFDPLLVAGVLQLCVPMVEGPGSDGALERFVEATWEKPGIRRRWGQLDKFWSPPASLAHGLARARSASSFTVAANLDGRSRPASRTAHQRLTWRHVPQLLWLERSTETVPLLFDRGWFDHQRRFLSLALARHLSPELTSWAKAAAALGLPGEAVANCNRASSSLRQSGRGHVLDGILVRLTAALDALDEPVDYADRRGALADLDDLDTGVWEAVVVGTGRTRVNRHWEARRRSAAGWVWVTATGGDFHLAPALRTYELPPGERRLVENRYRRYFVQVALPEVEDALADVARTLLERRGLPGPLVQVP